MKTPYLKIPVEMAQFALTEAKYKQVRTYLASQFIYSGKARLSDKPQNKVANLTKVKPRTIYRHFKWLLQRNWMGKDTANGWYFFRGLDRIHAIENWQFARAVILHKKDLKNIKAFMAGAVMASLVQTGKGQRKTEPVKGGSLPTVGQISLSVLADTLEVSTSTAYRLRKLADKCNYIENKPTLTEITNWTPDDLKELKRQDLYRIPVELLGYADKKVTAIDRIRYKDKKLYLQEPNTIKSLLHLNSRRGLSQYSPKNPCNNVIQECH